MNETNSKWERWQQTVPWQHVRFYVAACLVTLALSYIYLSGDAAGSGWAWKGLPLDDNWIHLVYARSFAEQGWFYYNPGVAEAGMSSPLWVVLLAVVYKIGGFFGVSPQWCAKGLSLFFMLGVPIVVYHLVLALRLRSSWAWIAGLLVACEPNLAYGAVAGMEVPLFSLLTMGALLSSWRRNEILTGVLLGLLVFTRGEAVLTSLLIGAGVLVPLYLRRKRVSIITKRERRIAIRLFLPPLLLGGAWAVYNYTISGQWLPNTYYVKHYFGFGVINLTNLWNLLLGYFHRLALFQGFLFLFVVVLLVGAGWALVRNRSTVRLLPLLLIPLVQIYAFSINIKVQAVEDPWTYFTRRYLDYLLPMIIVLMVLGADFLWKEMRKRRERWLVFAAPVIVVLGLAVGVVNMISLNAYFIEQYSWNTRNIEEVNVAMGRWMAENIEGETVIALTDAGAMRYFSNPENEIVDFPGLNCWECIGRPMSELIEAYQPEYLVVFRQALDGSFAYEEIVNFETERNTILGGSDLVFVRLPQPEQP
jgi:hypothetical protein